MRFAAIALATLTTVGCHDRPTGTAPSAGTASARPHAEQNAVVLYLKGAEQQFETEEQGAEIRRALDDMLTLGPEALCARRYADYGLTRGRWTIGDLLRHYVVPKPPQTIDDAARFCRDAASPDAKAVIQEHIRAIDEHRQPWF